MPLTRRQPKEGMLTPPPAGSPALLAGRGRCVWPHARRRLFPDRHHHRDRGAASPACPARHVAGLAACVAAAGVAFAPAGACAWLVARAVAARAGRRAAGGIVLLLLSEGGGKVSEWVPLGVA